MYNGYYRLAPRLAALHCSVYCALSETAYILTSVQVFNRVCFMLAAVALM